MPTLLNARHSRYTPQTPEIRTFIRTNHKQPQFEGANPMKRVKDIMSANPACCTSEHNVQQAAEMMVKHDCGEIPVVENEQNMKPMGVITDRDIACRVVATGKSPNQTKVRDAMSSPPVTVTPDAGLEECCQIMEENQIRRVPVVDERGRCCGIVSQADIAKAAPTKQTAKVVKQVSEPNEHASRVAA
jgi:CBS domain-containing protein